MKYDAYTQFIAAARKFPRWTNIRRRPIESNGGKVLRSIIEEIAEVENAIHDYRKNFFLVNYFGREDEIVDYLYTVQIGDITDLDALVCVDPACLVTDDKETFYADKNFAYYENGCLVMYKTNEDNVLKYTYQGNPYEWPIKEEAIWNIFDEFAWWCGLERFPGEKNASLAQRCFFQLRYSLQKEENRHPSSTEEGLKNVLINAAIAKTDLLDDSDNYIHIDPLRKEEIHFLPTDETTLAQLNDEGISLYEEISRFNRDIARTRQWDIDYWDNAFRKLYYLPHVWDAPVDIYKNGVGYNNSLFVSTAKEMGVSGKTDITVTAYADSQKAVEQYVQSNNIQKEIPLRLLRYNNQINPLSIQYRIVAENLFKADPKDIRFDFFDHITGEHEYYLDEFNPSFDDSVIAIKSNPLEKNKDYTLIFHPEEKGIPCTIEIERCMLSKSNGAPQNLLENKEDGNFHWSGGKFVHRNVLLHADIVDELSAPQHLIDDRNGGFTLDDPLAVGSFQVPLHDACKLMHQPVKIGVEGGRDNITYNTAFVKQKRYTRTTEGYLSQENDTNYTETFTIYAPESRIVAFTLEPRQDPTSCEVNVYINNVKDESRSAVYVLERKVPIEIELDTLSDIQIEIVRTNPGAFYIKNIERAAYDIKLNVNHMSDIPYSKMTMLLPIVQEEATLYCEICNYTGTAPIIKYIHIGPDLINMTYTLEFNTNDATNPELEIRSNCRVELYEGKGSNKQLLQNDFDTHVSYRNTDDQAVTTIYLDLSRFTKIYSSVPEVTHTVSYGEDLYYIVLAKGETRKKITIYGEGYALSSQRTLKDLHKIGNNKQVYFSRLLKGYILDGELHAITYDSISLGNRVSIHYTPQGIENPDATLSCFFNVTDTVSYLTKDYTGKFEQVYLYANDCQQYIAYNTQNMICEAEDFPIIPSFLPSIPEHALVCYVLDHTANDGATVLFKEGKTWTMNGSEKIHITVSAFQDPANNPNIFAADIVTIHPHVLLANQISLEGLTDDNGIPLALERYIVEPPDTMEVSMSEMPAPKIQYTYEDGSAMYVEEDGFNKLADSNIKEILYVKLANGTTVPSSYYTLIPKGGLIVWKNAALIANAPRIQEIKYTYYKPTHLRFKTLNGLYDIVGYSSKTMEKLGSYVIFDKEETKPDVHDPELMIEYAELLPSGKTKKDISRISFICTNSFFRARQEGDNIIVSKVAEDTAPVIHNGYYYINGKEYWFFANQYEQKENKLEGVEIENAETIRNILLLKQSAVNYLQNSRMECNKLGVHCMIDFTYPRNEANQEPLKHIGACDSFAGWQDYGMIRTLVPSQNGYATTFTTRDDNGYAILDITQAIGKHHTISCLFSGSLSFWLGQEIKILGERTRKTIFCKRIQAFTAHDGIAYTSLKDIDLNQGRYYVIVEGNGQLDEILIHDAEQLADIEAWHVKAIDKLGFITQEQEAEGTITDLEYDTEFMTYTNLETGTDGKLRTGTTVDWNISQFNEFNLSKGNMRKFLYRNQSLVAQANGAIYETEPIEIRYAHSIRGLACKINRYIEGKFKGFSVTILASANQYSNYEPIATESNTNLITFPPEVRRKFYKVRITAKEGQVVEQIQILAAYKEVSTESLPVYYHPEGSAVTKIFDTGANGDYKFKEVISDQNSLWKAIYMRGARISMNKEMIWTSWKDIATLPEFPNCQLFQFKILMEGKNSEAKINGFRLEVLSHV